VFIALYDFGCNVVGSKARTEWRHELNWTVTAAV